MDRGRLHPEADGAIRIDLPAVVAGPFRTSVGQIRQVLREALSTTVERSFQLRISTRLSATAYELASGETVVLTERPKLARPGEVSGVLRVEGDGKLRWIDTGS